MNKRTPNPRHEVLSAILATQQRSQLDSKTMLRENNTTTHVLSSTKKEPKRDSKKAPCDKKFTHLYVLPSNY